MVWRPAWIKSWEEAPVFYWLFTSLVVLGAAVVLIPNTSLMHIMLWPQVINGALLPFVLIFMLILINNKDIMGDYTNNWGYNLLAWDNHRHNYSHYPDDADHVM